MKSRQRCGNVRNVHIATEHWPRLSHTVLASAMGCGASRSVRICIWRVQPHPPPTLTPTPQQPEAQAVTLTAPTPGTEEASLTGSQVREEGTAVEPPEETPELGQPDWKPADSGEGEGEEQGGGDEEVGLEEQGGGDEEEGKEQRGGDKREEVGGELIQVESIASGDLDATFGTSVEMKTAEKSQEEQSPAIQPVRTHGRDAEPADPRGREEGGGGEGVELTLVEAISDKDGREDKEINEEATVGEGKQGEVEGMESGHLVPARKTQPTATIIHVKPVAGTLVMENKGKADGLKSSSSSSLTRIRSKASSGEKSNGREDAKSSGSLTQLKSASATHIAVGRARERGTSPRVARSRESLKAASQAYASVSRSRESLKKAESKQTSRSRESLKGLEQQMVEKPQEVPLKAVAKETTPSVHEATTPGQGDSRPSEGEAVREREDDKARPSAQEGSEKEVTEEERLGGRQTTPSGDERMEKGTPTEPSEGVKTEGPEESEEQPSKPSEGTGAEKRDKKAGEPSEGEPAEQAEGGDPGAEAHGTETSGEDGRVLATTTAEEAPLQPDEPQHIPDTKATDEGKGETKDAEAESREAPVTSEATTEPSNAVEKVEFEAAQEDSGKGENKPKKAETVGSKSSLRGSRVKLTSSNKQRSSGSKSSLSKHESASRQSQHEEGERKSPSLSSLKVDKKTGQSESSIMEAVERSKSEEGGRPLGHEATKDAINTQETCSA